MKRDVSINFWFGLASLALVAATWFWAGFYAGRSLGREEMQRVLDYNPDGLPHEVNQ